MNIRFSAITPADLRVKGNVIGHANRKQPSGDKTLYEITDLPLRDGPGWKPKVAITNILTIYGIGHRFSG